MPFHFKWKDEKKRAICYIAAGNWNWKDYHQAARASAFTLAAVDHPVDSVIDLRASARTDLPAGAPAHVRSFGRGAQPCLTGRAAVIGLPTAEVARLDLRPDRTLPTANGFVQFVDSEDQFERLLAEWADDPPVT